jgi:uncharacterized phage-associated protein
VATVYDVAQYIISKYGRIDAMKLQKLVYYSQAWRIVQSGAPLFDEPIKAYRNGPVVGLLYFRHKHHWTVTSGTIGCGSKDALAHHETQLVDAVLGKYGDKSPGELSALTHTEEPWIKAWAMRHVEDIITPGAMQDFYSKQFVFEPALAPELRDMAVTYVVHDDLEEVLESLDEPDDISGILRQLSKARARIGA